MPKTYDVVTQAPGIEFVGGTKTKDVMVVGITTHPSDIYLEFSIPEAQWDAALVKSYGIGYSGTVEAIAALPNVAGMTYVENLTAGNQLQQAMIVYVTSTSGNSQGQITVPYSKLAAELVEPMVKKLVASLDDSES